MKLRLFDSLPDSVTVDGKRHKMDFDFRNVLRMMETLSREDLVPEARDYLALKCLTKRPRNVARVLQAVNETLFEKEPSRNEKRITSFKQDAPLIRAAFRQVYGIDLFRDRLHWLEFTDLLHGLPEGNRYEEVLGIRSRPIPAPNKWNQKEREWLMQAKQSVALHLSEREAERKYEQDAANVFKGIMALIQKEVNADNGK